MCCTGNRRNRFVSIRAVADLTFQIRPKPDLSGFATTKSAGVSFVSRGNLIVWGVCNAISLSVSQQVYRNLHTSLYENVRARCDPLPGSSFAPSFRMRVQCSLCVRAESGFVCRDRPPR